MKLDERADMREAYIRYREGDCVGCLEVFRSVQRSTTYRRGAADAMLQEGLLLIDAGYPEEAAAEWAEHWFQDLDAQAVGNEP